MTPTQIAWKKVKGRASHNHFTTDKKSTLCGKDIPDKSIEAVGKLSCRKCLDRKVIIEACHKSDEEKIVHFKKMVEEYGGHYELDETGHRAWWDAYDSLKNLYIVYGIMATMVGDKGWLDITGNWIRFKP